MELVTSPLESDHALAQSIFQDWSRAKGRMITELVTKLAHWQQLPWKLIHMAHERPGESMLAAQQCLALWARGGPGTKHRQSRRFLDPHWSGGPSDPSLLCYVKQLASGKPLTDPDMTPLQSMLGRFRLIRVVERRVEGIHAQVTHCVKRARRASVAYISVELRFKDFWKFISSHPGVPCSHIS